jgi:hypothetical protein
MKQNFANRLLDKRAQRVLADIGGEALDGSGFEHEKPDDGFTAPTLPLGLAPLQVIGPAAG